MNDTLRDGTRANKETQLSEHKSLNRKKLTKTEDSNYNTPTINKNHQEIA